jgi:hypothetical protein
LVIDIGCRSLAGFLNESRIGQPLERSVECTRLESDGTISARFRLAHDGVAMGVTFSENEKDLELHGSEGSVVRHCRIPVS